MEAHNISMNLDPQWIVGFVDGEGCFHIGINANTGMSLGYQVLPEFSVVQHERDITLLYALKDYFKCGEVNPNHDTRKAFRVRSQETLSKTIIPFFEKHKLKTKKRIDFEKFRDVLLMMAKKEHLTVEGLAKIRKIANLMNRKRLHNELQLANQASQQLVKRVESVLVEDIENDA